MVDGYTVTQSPPQELPDGSSHKVADQPPCEYDPQRVYTEDQLEVFQMLVSPIWIWDFIGLKMVRLA